MNITDFGVKTVGVSWTKNQISTAGHVYYDVCWNGTAWCLVGNNGAGTGLIYTASTPSGTWTSRSPTTSAANLYACATNGARFVVVGATSANPGVYSNDNGATWTLNGIHQAAWRGLCFGGGLFVAVANTGGGTPLASTSSDGITWTSQTIGTADWEDVFYGGGLYVAVGRAGAISTSPDGVTWTARTSGTTDNLWRVRYKAGVWLTVGAPGVSGAGRALLSYDGITWANQTLPAQAENLVGLGVHKNWFLAGPQASTYSAQVWRSISGLTGGYRTGSTGIPTLATIYGIASDGVNIVAIYTASSDNGVLISS